MAYRAVVIPIFIAHPRDTEQEVQSIIKAVQSWNDSNSESAGIWFCCKQGATNVVPSISEGKKAQKVIIDTVLAQCDLVIAVFKNQLGSSGEIQDSGTVAEIMSHIRKGKPALIYLKKLSVDTCRELIEQMKKFEELGNVFYYSDCEELSLKITSDLGNVIEQDSSLKHIIDGYAGIQEQLNDEATCDIRIPYNKQEAQNRAAMTKTLIAEYLKWPKNTNFIFDKDGNITGLARNLKIDDAVMLGIIEAQGLMKKTNGSLSKEASLLLVEACSGSNNQIIVTTALGGTCIQSGKEEHKVHDSREKATWIEAVKELMNNGFISLTNSPDEIYEPTLKGWELYDRIIGKTTVRS